MSSGTVEWKKKIDGAVVNPTTEVLGKCILFKWDGLGWQRTTSIRTAAGRTGLVANSSSSSTARHLLVVGLLTYGNDARADKIVCDRCRHVRGKSGAPSARIDPQRTRSRPKSLLNGAAATMSAVALVLGEYARLPSALTDATPANGSHRQP